MTNRHCRTLTVICLLLTAAAVNAPAQEVIRAGDWTATLGPVGPDEISHAGETVARSGRLLGYLPAWQGGRFSMSGASLETDAASATWHKAEEGNQEATMRLELTEAGFRFSLDTTITAAGPSEFSLRLVPNAVRANENQLFTWLHGRPTVISLEQPFERIGGINELRFEQPDRTITLRCSGFELQDRREAGSDLFLVRVIGSSGEAPHRVQSYIEVDIAQAAPDELEGRREILAQTPVEYANLTVRNAGFEADEPLGNWSHNPNAAADTEVVHGGARSARIDIRPGDEDARPYLIQSVPAQEGRLYQASAWVRTQDVEAAPVGGMRSVGATVIVEFADRQGNWFAPGSYAQGLYGTNDWRHVSTGEARAPQGAGFAIIYLALRATGTAWFDDVELQEVRHYPVLLSPLPGADLFDNTPRLDWHFGPAAPTTVELSMSEDFPEGEVVRVEGVLDPPVSLDEPIPPGLWHWRVRSDDGMCESVTWAFNQTASLDDDTTEPRIVESHGHLATPDAPMRIQYSDNVGVVAATLVVNGEDVTAHADVGATELTYVPPDGWTEGLHVAQVAVRDAAGNEAERSLFFTHSPPMPRTVWRETGGVEVDGEMRFLFGMYGIRLQDMPEMAQAGFDYVHNYAWDGAGTNETALEYLDEAQRHGLQAFIGFNRRLLMAGDERHVAERVAALMGHPGLLAWYLYDEPDLTHQYVSPPWIERYYRLIRALDPYHPVVLTCAADNPVRDYRHGLDVHWTQVYGSTAFVAARIPRHRDLLEPGTPVAAILHCYDRAQSGEGQVGDPEEFQPDGRVMRANAFMALTKNSSGLLWWWWGQGSPRFFTVADVPEAWADLQQIVADIASLRPVLTAEGEIHTWVEEPAEGVQVHVWEKQTQDRTVIIAVNRDEQPCEVTLAPRTLPQDCALEVLFDEGQAQVTGGRLPLSFEPLGVHVLEWREGE